MLVPSFLSLQSTLRLFRTDDYENNHLTKCISGHPAAAGKVFRIHQMWLLTALSCGCVYRTITAGPAAFLMDCAGGSINQLEVYFRSHFRTCNGTADGEQ